MEILRSNDRSVEKVKIRPIFPVQTPEEENESHKTTE
jgi:hypothetical protein